MTLPVVCAETTLTPVTGEERLIVQEPVPPAVAHGEGWSRYRLGVLH